MHTEHTEDYKEGLQAGLKEGRLLSLERTVVAHAKKHDSHEDRFKYLERIVWGLVGAIALIQILPEIKGFLGG
jgi:hypothetical protein